LILINHEITYDTGMLGHLYLRCPPFQRAAGNAPVMHPCFGVPACNQQQKPQPLNFKSTLRTVNSYTITFFTCTVRRGYRS